MRAPPTLADALDPILFDEVEQSADRAASIMRRHRERRRDGLRCMTIELRATEIAALIRRGLLNEETCNDRRAIQAAFYEFLDRTLDR